MPDENGHSRPRNADCVVAESGASDQGLLRDATWNLFSHPRSQLQQCVHLRPRQRIGPVRDVDGRADVLLLSPLLSVDGSAESEHKPDQRASVPVLFDPNPGTRVSVPTDRSTWC